MRTFVQKMGYFHVYTKGLEDREIFRDRDDFIAGMNILAVVCFSCNVRPLVFVLMSNHFHFLLKGNREVAEKFIWLYKNLLSRYLRKRYGSVGYLRRLDTTVAEVDSNDDALKRLIAYILNNPVKAGINCLAHGYEWSSARCYFSLIDSVAESDAVSGYSVRELKSILHSNKKLPSHWRITASGYVDQKFYVDSYAVEKLFVRSRSFEYFLSSSLSIRKGVSENITFSDSVLISALNELLQKKYGVGSIDDLNDFLKANLVKDMKVRFSASSKQLARVLGMNISDIIRSLG